jgi:mannose-6-phosphate isomerase
LNADAPRDCGSAVTAHYPYPIKLTPSFRARIWGREDLSNLYPGRLKESERIGEVWLTADDNLVSNGPCSGQTLGALCTESGGAIIGAARRPADPASSASFPLLVKFLFTSDKLSLQVHPSDDYARRREKSPGKTEMWHVLKADAGARLAVGFRRELVASLATNRDKLLQAIASGELEQMLNWMEAREGDTFFVPPGCVHAIGAGLILCEIQQNSDITYRLYDYNRIGTDGHPRALHVEKALDVIEWQTQGGRTEPLAFDGAAAQRLCLAACPYFATEKVFLRDSIDCENKGRFEIWIGIEGEALFETAGESIHCGKGEVLIVPARAARFCLRPLAASIFLRSYEPDLDRDIAAPLRARGFSESQLSRILFSARPHRRAEAI